MGGRVGGEVQERWVGLEQPESFRQPDSLSDSVHNIWIRDGDFALDMRMSSARFFKADEPDEF